MKNISDKTKKWLAVSGGLVICAVLIVMISLQFKKESIEDITLPDPDIQVSDVIIEKPNDTGKTDTVAITEKEDEIVVPPIKILKTQSTNKNGVDKGTDQTIQKDVEKPKEPTKEQLTDPAQKPNGEKVQSPPEPVDHEKVEKPVELPKKNDEPKGGDTKNGQIFVPGFGWIDDIGEGVGSKAEDMYENGNKVGTMD